MKFLTELFRRAANQLPLALRRLFSPTNSETDECPSQSSKAPKPRIIRKRKSFHSFMREEEPDSFCFSRLRRRRQYGRRTIIEQLANNESGGSNLAMLEEVEHQGCTKDVRFQEIQHEPDPEIIFKDLDGKEISFIIDENQQEVVEKEQGSDRGRQSDSDSEILRFVYGSPPSGQRQYPLQVPMGRLLERTLIRKEWWKQVIQKELGRRGERAGTVPDEVVALQPSMFKKSKAKAPFFIARCKSQHSAIPITVVTVIDISSETEMKIFQVPLALHLS